MNCLAFREAYSDWADGLLDEATEIAVRRHLASCRACRRLDEAYVAGRECLRTLSPPHVSTDLELQQRILRACAGRESAPAPANAAQLAVVAGVLVVIVSAGALGWAMRAPSAAPLESPRAASAASPPERRAGTDWPGGVRQAHDTSFGHDPFVVLPAGRGGGRVGTPARFEITVDWMTP
jgi:anti-sigma factor RsiW